MDGAGVPPVSTDEGSGSVFSHTHADPPQYLTVLVQTRSIRTLRDLTPAHLPMLNKIRQTVYSTCAENFGVAKNKLRLLIHYQPSYCE
jgi:hypothetical protein